MHPVSVGVIGVGNLGFHHARLYQESPAATLVGIVDTRADRAAEVAGTLNTRVYPSLKALRDAGADAVSVVVPTFAHHAVAKEALELGMHVLLEKPIAASLEEADDLTRRAKEKGRILMIGHVERYNRVLEALRRFPSPPRFIEAHRLGPFSPRNVDVGVVLDLMIHDIDIVLELVESPVARVEGAGVAVLSPTEDIANARLVFENGCVADLTASRISPERQRKIRVFKKEAYFSLDYLNQSGTLYYPIEEEGEAAGAFSFGGRKIVREDIQIEPAETLRLELEDFLQCVRKGKPPRVTGEHGREALALALRITEQIRYLSQ